MNLSELDVFTLTQAAEYAHVTRQAIYLAIKKDKIPAVKVSGLWSIRKEDLDGYRLNKYNKQLLKRDGENVYDLERGHFSVQHVSKIIASMLKRPYPAMHIYYLLRSGQLAGFRKGRSWVIAKEAAVALYEKEAGKNEDKRQLRFA